MGFLRLFIAGGDPGADSPYRFIGNDNICHLFYPYPGQPLLDLARQHLKHLMGFTLLQGFANTEDGAKAGSNGCADFLIDELIGFVQQLAALGMATDDVVTAGILEQNRRHLTGKSAGVSRITVLCRQLER